MKPEIKDQIIKAFVIYDYAEWNEKYRHQCLHTMSAYLHACRDLGAISGKEYEKLNLRLLAWSDFKYSSDYLKKLIREMEED